VDAAEARLEGVLLASRGDSPDLAELRRQLARAEQELGDAPAHRALYKLAAARIEFIAGDDVSARTLVDEALAASKVAGQREWGWRALEARADIQEVAGQPMNARRDREEALASLEDIGARLPRDLREVYWNDRRRRHLRSLVHREIGVAATAHTPATKLPALPLAPRRDLSPISSLTTTPFEKRLARILEVNSVLVGELD
jgi:hypothetical protein